MKLLEHRGKELLRKNGIRVPAGLVTNNKSYVNLSFHKKRFVEFFHEYGAIIIKGQVIGKNRKADGLIQEANNCEDALAKIHEIYQQKINRRFVDTLLIEPILDIDQEYFLSLFYDTETRRPRILFSKFGGTGIEERDETIITCTFSSFGLSDFEARELVKKADLTKSEMLNVSGFIRKIADCFIDFDCRTLEINPIIKTKSGLLFAGDAKIEIDDNAIARHDEFADITELGDKSFLSEREIKARKIDYYDHRGVAGKTFVDLDGNIAVLASGGGASLVSMDALITAGGMPSNYTEYSGNPPGEKVEKLTRITLNKKNLAGCLVIGGRANFTDVFETLSGFAAGLKSIEPRPTYPIVIRRAGPRSDEARLMIQDLVKDTGLNISFFGEEIPISAAAKIMVEKSREYLNGNIN